MTDKDAELLHRHGLSLDVHGHAIEVLDPSANVLRGLDAAVARLDDVAAERTLRFDADITHLKEISTLRADHGNQLRTSDLLAANKTREVDVLAGAASAAALATAVSALQATSDRNAETLRNQVNTTATNMAKQASDAATAAQVQIDSLFRRTDERVAALERAAATGVGRQSVVDPQMAELLNKMDHIVTTQAQGTGKGEGGEAVRAASRANLMAAMSVVGFLALLVFNLLRA